MYCVCAFVSKRIICRLVPTQEIHLQIHETPKNSVRKILSIHYELNLKTKCPVTTHAAASSKVLYWKFIQVIFLQEFKIYLRFPLNNIRPKLWSLHTCSITAHPTNSGHYVPAVLLHIAQTLVITYLQYYCTLHKLWSLRTCSIIAHSTNSGHYVPAVLLHIAQTLVITYLQYYCTLHKLWSLRTCSITTHCTNSGHYVPAVLLHIAQTLVITYLQYYCTFHQLWSLRTYSITAHPTSCSITAHPTSCSITAHPTSCCITAHPTSCCITAHPTSCCITAHPTNSTSQFQTSQASVDSSYAIHIAEYSDKDIKSTRMLGSRIVYIITKVNIRWQRWVTINTGSPYT